MPQPQPQSPNHFTLTETEPLEKVWGPRPLQLFVLDVIGRKGPLTDDELLRELRNGKEDMSFRELNRILMKLEVNGLVRVSRQMKGKRRVELAEERTIR